MGTVKRGEKKAIAVAVVRENAGKPRKDVLPILETKLGMKRAGANTYYYLAKKVIAAESDNSSEE